MLCMASCRRVIARGEHDAAAAVAATAVVVCGFLFKTCC